MQTVGTKSLTYSGGSVKSECQAKRGGEGRRFTTTVGHAYTDSEAVGIESSEEQYHPNPIP